MFSRFWDPLSHCRVSWPPAPFFALTPFHYAIRPSLLCLKLYSFGHGLNPPLRMRRDLCIIYYDLYTKRLYVISYYSTFSPSFTLFYITHLLLHLALYLSLILKKLYKILIYPNNYFSFHIKALSKKMLILCDSHIKIYFLRYQLFQYF